MRRRISIARQSAEMCFPGPTLAGKGESIAMIAGSLGSSTTPGNWFPVLRLDRERRPSTITQGDISQLWLLPQGSHLLGVRRHIWAGFSGVSRACSSCAAPCLGLLGFFSLFLQVLILFALIFTQWFGVEGVSRLICAGWGLLGLLCGFSFVSQAFLALSCSRFYPFARVSKTCLHLSASPLSLLVTVVLFHRVFLFFASSLLCFYLLIIFLIPSELL